MEKVLIDGASSAGPGKNIAPGLPAWSPWTLLRKGCGLSSLYSSKIRSFLTGAATPYLPTSLMSVESPAQACYWNTFHLTCHAQPTKEHHIYGRFLNQVPALERNPSFYRGNRVASLFLGYSCPCHGV